MAKSRPDRFKAQPLWEQVVRLGKPEKVDRTAGVLYGVKILGLESANNRRYTPEAVKAALPLYEGLGVYKNHPKKADEPRLVEDRFGWFENVKSTDDGGLRGDLHLVHPTCDLAIALFNAAEQKPDLYGFSHNAEGDGFRDETGVFVVEAITNVRSVDLVSEPATTGGIFEERRMAKKLTLRKLLAEIALPKAAKSKLPGAKKYKAFVEALSGADAPPVLDEEMDDEIKEDDYGQADWKSCIVSAIGQLTSSAEPASHEMASKLLKMLKPEEVEEEEEEEEEETPKPGEGEAAVKEEEEEEESGDKKESKKIKRLSAGQKALQEQVAAARKETEALKAQLKEEKEAAAQAKWLSEEIAKRKLVLPPTLLESIANLKDRKKITTALDEAKTVPGTTGRQPPRSQGRIPITEETKLPTNGKEFAEVVKARR